MSKFKKTNHHASLLLMIAFVASLFLSSELKADEDQVSPLPEGAFSFVVLPDTQGYVNKKRESIFASEIQWILDHRVAQKIQFVSHVGDIVDRYKSMKEWKIAKRQMMKLHGIVPFAFSVGNHDMVGKNGKSDNFQNTFPASMFEEFNWYAGQIKNNADSFQIFEVDGFKFIWIHIECNAPDDILEWANDVFKKYPDRRAMVTTHMYLGPEEKPKKGQDYFDAPKGRMKWYKTHGKNGNTPQQMWEKCFSLHKNLFLICCGDQSRSQTMYLASKGVKGNTVHQCLSDYRGGNLRLLRLMPSQNKVSVITYSPFEKKLNTGSKLAPDKKDHQFVFEYEMKK